MKNSITYPPSFKFHHIGSLTSNLDKSEKVFNSLGFVFKDRFFDPIQEVKLSFGKNDLGVLLELVEPNKGSKVDNLLKRNGPGTYHICFEVDSILEEEKKLNSYGFIQIKKAEKAIAFHNRLVAFYYSSTDGIIELLER